MILAIDNCKQQIEILKSRLTDMESKLDNMTQEWRVVDQFGRASYPISEANARKVAGRSAGSRVEFSHRTPWRLAA